MQSVNSLSTTDELARFFDYLYGEQEGFVYSPTKHPEQLTWEQYFFAWPTEKERLIRHVEQYSPTHEVYTGPALFSKRGGEKEDFAGSSFVWAEFDGKIPSSLESVPEPSIKVQSSESDHQHWYWKLDGFITDPDVIEDISQRLAYHLGADLGCWNANRVLRPPGTIHHESSQTVSVLRWDVRNLSITDFIDLPALPVKLVKTSDIKFIPTALDVIAKYGWSTEDFAFFKLPKLATKEGKPEGQGHRSAGLAKLGHICMEMGMSNAETLAILLSADDRWGKFAKRKDRKDQLLGIINYCRTRHPVDVIVPENEESRLRVFTYEEFMNTEIKVEWLVEGLLHAKGCLSLSGPPGVGKSQLTIRMAEKLAKGETMFKWQVQRPTRTLMVSMEMPHEELKHFMDVMRLKDPDGMMRDNFMIMPIGSSLKLGSKHSQFELNKVIEKFQPEVIMFDSLGVALGDEISSDSLILNTFDYVAQTLRIEFGAACWFIHHHRKAQIGNKKPDKLDDLYGSQYIGAALSTAIGLWPVGSEGKEIEVSCLKLRMSEKFKPFKIKRVPGLDFEIVTDRPSTTAIASLGGGFGSDLGDSI